MPEILAANCAAGAAGAMTPTCCAWRGGEAPTPPSLSLRQHAIAISIYAPLADCNVEAQLRYVEMPEVARRTSPERLRPSDARLTAPSGGATLCCRRFLTVIAATHEIDAAPRRRHPRPPVEATAVVVRDDLCGLQVARRRDACLLGAAAYRGEFALWH